MVSLAKYSIDMSHESSWISPLWRISRLGWARSQEGLVLVEKRGAPGPGRFQSPALQIGIKLPAA